MATIAIQNLSSEHSLFVDDESFLTEVGTESTRVIGGVTPGAAIITAATLFTAGYGFGYAVGSIARTLLK
jgi:hypothetical protein